MIQILLAAMLAFAAPVHAKAPSSKIPDKREFPLNESVRACDDFHQYVCSNVEASFKLRDDRSTHDFAFSDSSERLLEIKKKFMKELPAQKKLPAATEQARDFYMSCMNAPAKARSEKAEVARIVKEVGQLKTIDELIAYSHEHVNDGYNQLLGIGATANLDDPKKTDAVMALSFMELPDHKYYEQEPLMKEYEALITQFYQNIYPGIEKPEAVEKAKAMIALQRDFIKIYPVSSVRRERWSERRISTPQELMAKYPNLRLDLLFAKLPAGLQVNTTIPESLEFLDKDTRTRPLQVWKDIFLFDALNNVMDDGFTPYFNAAFDFEKKFFGGPQKRSERQERCTRVVGRAFGKEIDFALVDKVFPNFDENKVNAVASKIRQSILDGLESNTWLSKDGKKAAMTKIKTARLQLVKPHNDREWDFVPRRKYNTQDFLQNTRTLNGALWEKTVKELSEPTNQDAWGMSPLTVNAYYSPSDNKFVLPIGILQFPFYDKDGTLIENLGAVGAVAGHEIGHSIDDGGSKYDFEGRLKPWMSAADLKEFTSRGQVMVDQFNKIGHDGKLTLGENVADFVGLSFAYRAAFPDGKGSAEDKQKFFVGWGRIWCNVTRPDYEAVSRKTDPHSAGWARINEQVKHQPGFAEAFQCKDGDKMTLPERDRVKVW